MPEFKKPQQDHALSLLAILIPCFFLLLSLNEVKHTHQATEVPTSHVSTAAPVPSLSRMAPKPVAHFNFMDLIAKPLFFALRWIHEHIVANWGWSILALTLCVNLALMPMRLRSMRSQFKLQRLQPEIAAIKARFNGCKLGDPLMQAMNQEIFALQKREGVSLLGNLLPFLIQMPLL